MTEPPDASSASQPPLFGQHDPVFRPWPLPTKQPTNIAEFVVRLKAQGIEFRDLTDEGLRQQIEDEEKQELKAKDAAAGHAVAKATEARRSGDDDNAKPKGIEAMIARRDEALRYLENATQNGLVAVDFVSLLLSKDRPTQAMQTLSPLLRDKAGIGTLSAGRIANAAQAARALQIRSRGGGGGGSGISAADFQSLDETTRTNTQRLVDHKTECVGWQLLAMDRASDMLAAARKRLRAELRREQTYWAEVMAVRDRGWTLSRMPGHRRVLRVRFGFSESAPDMRALGFAPLRRVKGGHVALDLSVLGPPSAIVVTLRRRRAVSITVDTHTAMEIGRSRPPARLPATAPLEDRILEARNTIYAKELWRELNREMRLLVSHGVSLHGTEIVFSAGPHTEGVIALRPLHLTPSASASGPPANDDNPALSALAETLATALQLLLAHGHREHYRQRSTPKPPSDTPLPPPTYSLLRPVIAHLKYEKAIENTATYLSDICRILHGVGQEGARFTLTERPLTSYVAPPLPQSLRGRAPSASENLCAAFLAPREFSFEFYVDAETRILIRGRTTTSPLKAQYRVHLLPPPSSPAQNNPLFDIFPPADNYGTLRGVLDYVGHAVAHWLAVQARRLARRWEKRSGTGLAWNTLADGMEICQSNDAFWRLRFRVEPVLTSPAAGRDADAQLAGPGADADADAEGILHSDSPLVLLSPPELRLYASWPHPQAETAIYRKWTWSAASLEQASDGATRDLEAIVEGCVSGRLKPDTDSPSG